MSDMLLPIATKACGLFAAQDLHDWFSIKDYGVGGRPCKNLIPKVQVMQHAHSKPGAWFMWLFA